MISVDFFSDLMSVLHSLAETGVCLHISLYAIAKVSGYFFSIVL